jgi:D-psicose/D-tagatose/L-ribulose 3-epimerase
MKLCVSNIAWSPTDDSAAYALLRSAGVSLVELAPTRTWPDLAGVTAEQAQALHAELQHYGLRPTAFQALFYGRAELLLFNPATRDACLSYLCRVVDLAGQSGVTALVFGSPKNRARGDLPATKAFEQAVHFFAALGAHASALGVQVCIEPNPREYGCDFINTVGEAATLVRAVASPGFRLHGDTGELIMNDEDVEAVLEAHGALLGHFHISEPFLDAFTAPKGDHRRIARALRSCGYDGIVSIEMKTQPTGLTAVSKAINFAREIYQC